MFDQAPEDELFPECQRRDIAVIARVPFDEGSLTGTLTPDTTWPKGDFRNIYFQPENLQNTLARVDALRPAVPAGMTMPELALRLILATPGREHRDPRGCGSAGTSSRTSRSATADKLPSSLVSELRGHRWDRWIDIP